MLILTRRVGEAILIGDDVTIRYWVLKEIRYVLASLPQKTWPYTEKKSTRKSGRRRKRKRISRTGKQTTNSHKSLLYFGGV